MASIIVGLRIAFRRPSLWSGTFIGIMLATMLIFGAFMATDYVSIGTINKVLEDVRVDIRVDIVGVGTYFFDDYIHYQQRIESIENVTYVDVFARSFLPLILFGSNGSSSRILEEFKNEVSIFFVNLDTEIDGVNIVSGSFGSSIGLGKRIAEILGVDVGDNITISDISNTSLKNVTIDAIVEFSGNYYDRIWWMDSGAVWHYFGVVPGIVYQKPELDIRYDPNYAIVIPVDRKDIFEELLLGLNMPIIEVHLDFCYLVSINRSRVINPWDLDGSIRRLERIENKIYVELGDLRSTSHVFVLNYVLWRLRLLSFTFFGIKFSFAIQLLPIVILGILLSLITNWIMVNRRRREIGLLRVKGMSSKQILIIHIVEAIIVGAVGSLIGLIVGYFFALYLIHEYAAKFVYLVSPEGVLSTIIWSYLTPCVVFGGILGLIAVIFPARRASDLSLEKALAEYVEEVEAEVKVSKKIIVLLMVSVYGIIELVVGMRTLQILFSLIRGGAILLILLLIFFIPLYFFAIFVGPFLFPYAFGKIIAAYSHRISGLFEKLAKPISGDLSTIAARNFIRKKTRAYKVILLIALTLAFGVFHVINRETSNHRARIDLEINIGADIRVSINAPIYFMNDISSAIENIKGIEKICYISEAQAYTKESTMRLIFLNKSYFDVSFIRDDYLEGLTRASAKEKIEYENSIILSIYAKREMDYKIGDEFILNFGVGEDTQFLNFSVIGFIKFAPAISDIFGMQIGLVGIVGYSVLTRISRILRGSIYVSDILIDVKDGYNATQIATNIQNALEEIGIGTSVYVFDLAMNTMNEHWIYLYSNVFVNIMLIMSLVMAIAGMTLTMVASILERRREIALLRVRGASKREIVGIISGEALVITILGYVIGLIVSLAYAYGILVSMNTVFYTFRGVYVEFPSGYAMCIPVDLFIILGIAFFLFIFSAILPLLFVFKEDISEELRIRH